MGDVSPRRPTSSSPRSDRRVGVLPILLVIAALVATCAGPTPTPSSAPPSAPSSTPAASGSPGVTPIPTPTASPGTAEWAKLDLPALADVARLEATESGAAGVAPTTAFRLTSLDGTPVRQLAKRLVATPAVKLDVAEVSGATAVLQPGAPLRHGQVYRFELRRTDGTAEAAWAVQAAWPLTLASSIPGDQVTGVPRDTGIEITFDQPGVRLADVRSHFSITPAVDGRWERHGETFVYVPLRVLARSTLYTVTIERGVPLPGTGLMLERDVVIRFETTGAKVSRVHMTVGRTLFDAAAGERGVIGLRFDSDEDEEERPLDAVTKVSVKVHRLPGLTAAIDAYRRIDASPDWTWRSSTTPVKTGALPLVMEGRLPLQPFSNEGRYRQWFRLPKALAVGWYVVTVTNAGISRQALLQVTDISAFSIVSETRSLVWVNDLRTNDPVAGARVTLGGATLGQTDAEGLAVGKTPRVLADDAAKGVRSFAVVRSAGRTMFMPLVSSDWCYDCGGDSNNEWWRLLSLDRAQYRPSDTINAWGVVRNRDTGKVPASVTVRLSTDDGYGAPVQPAIASETVSPDASGAFLAHLRYADVPPGDYRVTVRAGTTIIGQAWLSIGPISKPAWQIELSTPKHAVLSGTGIPVTAVGSFFEGTPVAGADLRFDTASDDEDEEPVPILATTDADGTATATVAVRLGGEDESQWSPVSVDVRANEPEEGDVSSWLEVMVFRSTAVLDVTPTLAGKTLTITGAVHDVVFARFDEPGADLWSVDPRGAPRPNATVTLQLTEKVRVVRQTGTRYDFIAKRTVPVYDVSEREVSLGTRTATTGADGTFRLTVAVTGGEKRSYEVRARYTDEAGRTVVASESPWEHDWYADERPSVESVETGESWGEYSVGDTIRVRFRGGIDDPETQRYLFAVMSRGLRTVAIQDRPRFAVRFTESLVPTARIAGVRFTGTGYEVSLYGFGPSLRTADRALDVQLTADRDRYAPGDRATVAVRTLDASGRPVAASVFVYAVDEKLFAMGAAFLVDPLDELYASTGSGLLARAWSHAGPEPDDDDGKGDTTGGGDDRSDFRDWLLAKIVTTDANGRASVSFDLSDDLTSWRVVANGVTPELLAGQDDIRIPVSLPFFADVVVAPEYLSVDRPVIRVRAYGTSLAANDPVTFRITSDTLPMAVFTAEGMAFTPVEVPLPALAVGTHRLRIEASTGTGTARRTDTLVRTFTVVETRAIRSHTASVELATGTTVDGGSGLTYVTLVDAGRGSVVPLLRELASSEPFRADRALAAAIARDLLADEFGIPDSAGLPEPDLLAFQPEYGVSLLPYASEDLELSAMAAFSGDPRVSRDRLHWYFQDIVDNAEYEGSLPTSRELFLLLGRASLGEASLAEVGAAAARMDLTPVQRVTVALAALAVGDEPLAREVYRDLLARYGERLGPWVRVKVGTAEETAIATARLAIVAAALGDPIAADMDAELRAHPPKDTLVDLERAIAASYWAASTPKADAVAAITLDGRRTEVKIGPEEPVILEVTPAQREGLRIDPVRGTVLVISQWDGPVAIGDLAPPAGQSIVRTVTPAGVIGPTTTVVVTFQVTLGSNADDGCWRVTDFAPSGLAPIAGGARWDEEDEEGEVLLSHVETPWRVVGQRVDFCVSPDPLHPVHTLRYLARVVTTGTYRWESAVLQSSIVPEQGIVLPAFEVTIGGPGS